MTEKINICHDLECVIFHEVGKTMTDVVLNEFGYTKKFLRNGRRKDTKCVLDMTNTSNGLDFDLFIGDLDPYKEETCKK